MSYPQRLLQLPALALLLATTGCQPRTVVFMANNEITATGRLEGIRHTEHGDRVTGKLKISGSGRTLVSTKLPCFVLYIGAVRSKDIGVDSHGDNSRDAWPASNGSVNVNVYWSMPDDLKLTETSLRDAKLAVEKPSGDGACFEFAADPEN